MRDIEKWLLSEQWKVLMSLGDNPRKGALVENQERFRLGLSADERRTALQAARKAMEGAVCGVRGVSASVDASSLFGSRFSGLVTIDVAVWARGVLRGSQIIMEKPFHRALYEASVRAVADPRFKPIDEEELSSVRIEITLMSSIQRVLSREEKEAGAIHPEMGYRLRYADQMGWYFPEVFNCVRFRNLGDLSRSLAVKIGLSPDRVMESIIEEFEVEDFIESFDQSQALGVVGPVIQSALSDGVHGDDIWEESLEESLKSALEHLLGIQEPDGNMPPIIDALDGRKTQIDWVRLAGISEALVSAGLRGSDNRATSAAERISEYLSHHLYTHPSIRASVKMLGSTYHAKTLFALGRVDDAVAKARKIVEMMSTVSYEPIAFLQAASLFSLFDTDDELIIKAEEVFLYCHDDYLRKKASGESFELACFPEAIPVAWRLFRLTGKAEYEKKAAEMEQWFIGQQLSDGSFPSRVGGGAAYVRGTGKIFEVLAFRPERNKQALVAASQWLLDMQYTKENSYFIHEDFRRYLLGGFRHDALNPDVWIDASAHVMLGSARILER